ncbi:MAG: response regulator [Bacteriovorax sp.]|nr:response regulator [Bacteriovorax sp.]
MNKKVKILVVDHRLESFLTVQAVLDSPDYNVVSASSGSEALKHLLKDDFAVILLDVQMPIMNGFETAEIIMTREKYKDIPIVFMSDINQDEHYVYHQGYKVGAVDYLLKPIDPYILRSKVAVFVDIYQKKNLIREQAQKICDNEMLAYAASINNIELESLRRYQNLADSLPQIVFRVKASGSYEYFNKVWFEYTGLNSETSFDIKWQEVIHLNDLNSLISLFEHAENKNGIEIECRILNRHGEFRWHLIRIQPELYWNSHEIKSWLGTATDIEDRKKLEDTQRFLSHAGEILVSSLDSTFIFESVSRLSVPYLADWCSFDVMNNDDVLENLVTFHPDVKKIDHVKALHDLYWGHPNSEDDTLKVLASGKAQIYKDPGHKLLKDPHLNKEQIILANELCETSFMIIPLIAHGHSLGTMTFATHGIGRKYDQNHVALAEELGRRVALAFENAKLYKFSQRAIEVRNDFLSIASHELNTPITSVKLQLQMVNRTLTSSKHDIFPVEKFKKSIDTSVKQVDRLINLVQALLDVSCIQSGQFNFTFENVNVLDMVNDVVDRHKELLQSYSCTIKVYNPNKIHVIWDKTRMEQVLTNLINNAIKYAPGKIEVDVSEEAEFVKICVKDEGKGIPADKINTIFDRFTRGNSPNSIGGLGLGLYIVKQIIEGHNGRIKIDSSINVGSCFTIILPKHTAHVPKVKIILGPYTDLKV